MTTRNSNESPLSVLQSMERFLGIEPHFREGTFSNLKINASGRRDLLYLNKLLANQNFLETIYRILPKPMIRTLRRWYERLSVPAPREETGPKTRFVSDEELALLEKHFSADTQFYNSLFASQPILIGGDRGDIRRN